MDARAAADELVTAVLPHAEAARAVGEQAYLKLPHWTFLGVATPPLRQAERAWSRAHKGLDHDDLWGVIEALWGEPGPTFEHRRLVSLLVEHHWKLLRPEDEGRLAHLFTTSETWALVDVMAVAVGRAVTRDAAWHPVLDRWAVHPDFWLRRTAILALGPGRQASGFDWPRFTRYAEPLLEDGPLCGDDKTSRFFLRKVLGWVLRDMSRHEPEVVARWLADRLPRLSGLTLREASRHLDEAVQSELLTAASSLRGARRRP